MEHQCTEKASEEYPKAHFICALARTDEFHSCPECTRQSPWGSPLWEYAGSGGQLVFQGSLAINTDLLINKSLMSFYEIQVFTKDRLKTINLILYNVWSNLLTLWVMFEKYQNRSWRAVRHSQGPMALCTAGLVAKLWPSSTHNYQAWITQHMWKSHMSHDP